MPALQLQGEGIETCSVDVIIIIISFCPTKAINAINTINAFEKKGVTH
jgi:hypothetical protein